jgi:hypothetical protein
MHQAKVGQLNFRRTKILDEQELIRLGTFIHELRRMQKETGFWLQNAELFSLKDHK